MSTATLRLRYRAIQRKVTSLPVVRINWKATYFLALTACAIMLLFYIFEVNQLTQGSFLIKGYNKQINNLLTENRDLQANFGQASFWGGIADKAQTLNFEKTTQVTYVKVLQNSLAKAK